MAPGNARRCGNCSTAETTQVANAIEFSASLAAQTALAGLGRAGCGGRLVKKQDVAHEPECSHVC